MNAYFSHFICSFACVCLGGVICEVVLSGLPLDPEMPFGNSVAYPVITHGNCFCHAMLHGCVSGADGTGIVADDGGWWLWIT